MEAADLGAVNRHRATTPSLKQELLDAGEAELGAAELAAGSGDDDSLGLGAWDLDEEPDEADEAQGGDGPGAGVSRQ